MKFIRAGQTCPFIIRGMESLMIEEGTIPIGFFSEYDYHDSELQLEVGDTLVMYSDGVNETSNDEGVMFGVERIEKHFLSLERESNQELLERLTSELRGFSGKDWFEDDVTMFLVTLIK